MKADSNVFGSEERRDLRADVSDCLIGESITSLAIEPLSRDIVCGFSNGAGTLCLGVLPA